MPGGVCHGVSAWSARQYAVPMHHVHKATQVSVNAIIIRFYFKTACSVKENKFTGQKLITR